MSLVSDMLSVFKAPNTERLPVSAGFFNVGTGMGTGFASNQTMNLMSSSGWLFAIIERISSSVAAADWVGLQMNASGEGVELPPTHPLVSLWESPNPFYSRAEMIEVLGQHFELTGEMWIVIVRDSFGMRIPVELWPVRPDRIAPVPSPTEFISGYMYQVGSEKIPLDLDDVIFIRRPSPTDPYRGIGVVGSMLADISSESAAAAWTNAFFRNSAVPGGVIEVDDMMSDADFDKAVMRWRTQHQGVNNSHRVAFLEGNMKWVDRKFTNRDIQLKELRNLSRDNLFGGFGMPGSVMGVTETVNRANAEAGQLMFMQNLVVPRLNRIKSAINMHLVPMFGDNLRLDFIDPTPANHELLIREGKEGYDSGVLLLNEARQRFGESPVDGGDEFKPRTPSPFMLMAPPEREVIKSVVRKNDPLLPDGIEGEERNIRGAWEQRFATETAGLSGFVESVAGGSLPEVTDLSGYDWDWWTKYGDDVISELTAVFAEVLSADEFGLAEPTIQRLASEYALERGATLLRFDGNLNLVNMARDNVNELVAQALENGQSLQSLQRGLVDNFAFSPSRAEMVARTETATALGQGRKQIAIMADQNEKAWVTQGDEHVDNAGICGENEDQGFLSINDMFQSGHDTIPGHPRCRCSVIYRTRDPEEEQGLVRQVHCPQCTRRLPVNNLRGPAEVYCRHCDETFEV